MDPENPIVKLCVAGMQAEGEHRYADARTLFLQAWESAGDDYERCIAAHFVARHQETPQAALQWNEEALARADAAATAVAAEHVLAFYPSLYLNLGYAHEQLGDAINARRFYALADAQTGRLSDDRYGSVVRGAVEAGLARLAAPA